MTQWKTDCVIQWLTVTQWMTLWSTDQPIYRLRYWSVCLCLSICLLPTCLYDWLTHWLTDWLADSLTQSITPSLTNWLTEWLTVWLIYRPTVSWESVGLNDLLTKGLPDSMADGDSMNGLLPISPADLQTDRQQKRQYWIVKAKQNKGKTLLTE